MSPHLYNNKLHIMSWMILFKKQLFDLEVKGQGPTKVITVRDTPSYGHAPTYQISFTYLERQKSYGPDKLCREEAEEKIRLKQYVSLHSKGRHNKSKTNNYEAKQTQNTNDDPHKTQMMIHTYHINIFNGFYCTSFVFTFVVLYTFKDILYLYIVIYRHFILVYCYIHID